MEGAARLNVTIGGPIGNGQFLNKKSVTKRFIESLSSSVKRTVLAAPVSFWFMSHWATAQGMVRLRAT